MSFVFRFVSPVAFVPLLLDEENDDIPIEMTSRGARIRLDMTEGTERLSCLPYRTCQ